MFRHSVKRGAKIGALSHSAASSVVGSALSVNWKGVQAYDYQHLELENIGSSRGERVRQQQVSTFRRVAESQSQGDENLSHSYRQTAGERRPCDCQVAAADGSAAMQPWSRRRICGGLVPASISAAATGRSGQRRRRNIFTAETAVSRIAGRLFRNSSRADLSQRSSPRLAGTVPGVWTGEPVFAVGRNNLPWGSVRQLRFGPSTENRGISDAGTGNAVDADGITGQNNTSGGARSGYDRIRYIPLYGEHP